ncbi:hypothetical protein OF83DRAFT_1100837 [Amylostereum chailletii]|nr:hypothetical protein OF83DRAFT_1100837 [Amylostereum chailletii]
MSDCTITITSTPRVSHRTPRPNRSSVPKDMRMKREKRKHARIIPQWTPPRRQATRLQRPPCPTMSELQRRWARSNV